MSGSFLPRGTQLGRSTDGVAFTTIGEARKIGLSLKGSFEDVSNMDSPSVYKEFLATLIDGGSVKIDCNFLNNDATQNNLYADFAAQTLLYWQIQFPTARGKATFRAFVEEIAPDLDVQKAAVNSVSLKISGLYTWTPNVYFCLPLAGLRVASSRSAALFREVSPKCEKRNNR
jgi:hypothetical protein